MITMKKDVLNITQELERLIGPVKVKALFNGYGVFKEDDMFGIIVNTIFYLRAEKPLAQKLLQLGAVPCKYNKLHAYYYSVPHCIRQDDEAFSHLLLRAIEQVKQQKQQIKRRKQYLIKALPNLNVKDERLFARVGIKTVSELRKVGAVNTFIRVKKLGVEPSLSLFWRLVGALEGKHCSLISVTERQKHLRSLNTALALAGLSPYVGEGRK